MTRAKRNNNGIYPFFVSALSKKFHEKIVDIVSLEDQLNRLSY
tara:strand:- start:23 stop:151 length:129 start_codon:yes stop_codon:yes gene_type:complete